MERLLTQEEIARIKQEEAFRADFRKEFTQPEEATGGGWKQIVWKFLNSAFGIWFLSAVVLAGGANIYNKQQMAYKEEEAQRRKKDAEDRRTKEIRERIEIEISYRLSSTMTRLKAVSEKCGGSLSPECQRAITEAFEPLRKPADEENPPLYPEYKSYSGLALIAELRRHVGEGEQDTLTEILAGTSGYIIETVGDKTHPKQSASAFASDLLDLMSYEAWDVGFPYTDCKDKEDPFC